MSPTLLFILGAIAVALLLAGLFTRLYLRGENLAPLDALAGPWAPSQRPPSDAHAEVLKRLADMLGGAGGNPMGGRLRTLRATINAMGDTADLSGITLRTVDAGNVPAEWVLAEGADPDRRLLYIHGGAWMMGSPKSHRVITTELARRTGAAVLAIDYRLMPEHARLACFEDCQTAYRWVLDHGPDGPSPVRQLFIAGDSAGGNLTLAITPWARDAGLRAADAVIALSPATDGTLSAPSINDNLATDAMLAPMFGRLASTPRWLLLWGFWLKTRLRPCDPRVSPLHDTLAGLPPTLVHVSEAEMLLDDARRYVAKARAAGSPASIESWPHMVHVWHFFAPILPEGREALARIADFIDRHAPRAVPPPL